MIIRRDFRRNQDDDFTLNVAPRLTPQTEALPLWHDDVIVGWKIITRYA